MKFTDLEINASPFFDATCPSHGNRMETLDNGWLSICFYCEKCKAPYQIKLQKMRKWNSENLKKILEKKKLKKNMTQSDFIREYCRRSGISEQRLNELGQFAILCQCGDNDCGGWAMISSKQIKDHVNSQN